MSSFWIKYQTVALFEWQELEKASMPYLFSIAGIQLHLREKLQKMARALQWPLEQKRWLLHNHFTCSAIRVFGRRSAQADLMVNTSKL